MMSPTALYLFSIHDHAKAKEHFFRLRRGFVSLLLGTYICTFSQKNLESSANVTIEVISLPLKQNILIDPITTSIQCEVPHALECCISAKTVRDYRVTFVVQQNEFQVGKTQ